MGNGSGVLVLRFCADFEPRKSNSAGGLLARGASSGAPECHCRRQSQIELTSGLGCRRVLDALRGSAPIGNVRPLPSL